MSVRAWLRFDCRSEVSLSRAVCEGPDVELANHLLACPRCAGIWRGLTRLQAFSRAMSPEVPDPARVEQTRTTLLASLRTGGPPPADPRRRSFATRRGFFWLGVLVAALLGAGQVALRLTHETPNAVAGRDRPLSTFHARIRPDTDALLRPTGDRLDERVLVHQGRVSFDVSPLMVGERFRVIAADGEVEVRGTSFEVVVDRERLVGVAVRHGRVAVRMKDRPEVVVDPGGQWKADPAAEPVPAGPNEAETLFIDAWSALRAGRFTEAATGFSEAARLTTDSALAEDADHWRAVALLRGDASTAPGELASFLRKYPRSPHADDASIALGWCYLDSGRYAEAQRQFRAALHAQDVQIRKSARIGLQRLRGPHP